MAAAGGKNPRARRLRCAPARLGWPAGSRARKPVEPVRLLVPVEAPGRPVRVNISMDEGLVARLDAAANRHGMSRSAFLAEAADGARRGRPEWAFVSGKAIFAHAARRGSDEPLERPSCSSRWGNSGRQG